MLIKSRYVVLVVALLAFSSRSLHASSYWQSFKQRVLSKTSRSNEVDVAELESFPVTVEVLKVIRATKGEGGTLLIDIADSLESRIIQDINELAALEAELKARIDGKVFAIRAAAQVKTPSISPKKLPQSPSMTPPLTPRARAQRRDAIFAEMEKRFNDAFPSDSLPSDAEAPVPVTAPENKRQLLEEPDLDNTDVPFNEWHGELNEDFVKKFPYPTARFPIITDPTPYLDESPTSLSPDTQEPITFSPRSAFKNQ